jgi:lipid II:glycine glycyltransferase (peptidoglycan interpeptide bridge formation enzyme)
VNQLQGTLTETLAPHDIQAYDEFVASGRGAHYSQSRGWAEISRAARPVATAFFIARRDERVAGAGLVLRPKILNTIALPIAQMERGPVVADARDFADVLDCLVSLVRKSGVLRLSVMPYWRDSEGSIIESALAQRRFHDTQKFAGRHVSSLRLDLRSLPIDNLFGGSALSKVRQNIRRAERIGASARRGNKADMNAFRRLHEQLLVLEGKRLPAESWYAALAEYFLSAESRGAMFVGEYRESVISVIFLVRQGDLATYAIGASSGADLPFPKMILPMAAAVGWAKEQGAATLDLGGIPMAGDTDAKRLNIAEFKRSFSRNEISFIHEHVRWF